MSIFKNVTVHDEVGRKYRVCFDTRLDKPLIVARKCLAGGREVALDINGRKGRKLIAQAREAQP